MSVFVYDYNNAPNFSIDLNADLTGFAMMELMINEFANLAKEALVSGDYEEALTNCRTAKEFQDAIQKAKDMLAEKEAEKEDEKAESEVKDEED